jgi:hypothetical protein
MYYPPLDRRLRGQKNGELSSSPYRTSTLTAAPTLHDTQATGVSHPNTLDVQRTLDSQQCSRRLQPSNSVQLP